MRRSNRLTPTAKEVHLLSTLFCQLFNSSLQPEGAVHPRHAARAAVRERGSGLCTSAFSTHQRESRLEHLQVIISIHLWLEKEQMMLGTQINLILHSAFR